ncbi:hypothetical protein [Halomonas halocynthiae]|uniref:hypothetical protein n=1 Tax=Halomonas halocynthiae TaxID=176290 RepID=UPI0012EC05B6|nr:hypothetical protein [Halomonas halocynthiae]
MSDYADITSLQQAFVDSLQAFNTHNNPFCMRYTGNQGMQIQSGFRMPIRHRVDYKNIELANSEILTLPDTHQRETQAERVILAGDTYCYLGQNEDAEPPAVRLQAEFKAQLPSDIITFNFSANDVGQTFEQGGVRVLLEAFGTVSFALRIETDEGSTIEWLDQDIVTDAQDSQGHYLAHVQSEREPLYVYERINTLLDDLFKRLVQNDLDYDTALAELEALDGELAAARGNAQFVASSFNGPVAQGQVTLLVYREGSQIVEQALDIPVHNMPTAQRADDGLAQLPEIEPTAPIYSGQLALRAERTELETDELAEAVQVARYLIPSGVSHPERDYPGQVAWYYPPVQSDLLIDRRNRMLMPTMALFEFSDVEGNPVKDPEQHNLQAKKLGFEVNSKTVQSIHMVGRLNYDPERFTGVPVRMTAQVHMALASNLTKQAYAVDELPAGMSFDHNRLVIDYSEFEPVESNSSPNLRRNHVFARDEQGYLAEMTFHSLQGAGQSSVDVYYFYGQPEHIEIWYLGELATHIYPIDVRLD